MKFLRIFYFLAVICFNLHAQTITFKLIETSDVHGNIFPYDFTENKPTSGSLSRVISYVNKLKAAGKDEVILLDNGDILQGTPAVYYYNFEKTDVEHLYASVMNYMNYDAATIGNHDIETGHKVYDKFNSEINFPWLAANAIDTVNNKIYFKPYTIIQRGKIRIAVLGLITPAIPNWLPNKIWEGMDFEDMILAAQKWVPEILEKEKPDLLVGLFHAGVDYNYGNVDESTPRNENACKLVAQQVPGFDIIFAGHDHEGWNFLEKSSNGKDVLIMGTTSGARNVAVANVSFNYDEKNSVWKSSIKGEIVDMKNYEPDSVFLKKYDAEFREIKEYVSRPIGELEETIDAREAMFGDASFSDLIHTVQLELTKADVSFTAPLSQSSLLKCGELFVKDMFNLYRYENLLYTIELTGKEIDDYLEYSYGLWFNEMKNENDDLLLFRKDDQGNLMFSERYNTPELLNRYYNFDSAEGIEYTVDVSKPLNNRVEIKAFTSGTPFETEKIYKVAVNSYRGNGGGGHLTQGAGINKDDLSKRIINSTDKDLRFYVMKWIEANNSIHPKANYNWNVIPEAWYFKAKEKDYNLLYGK